ncbi:YhgE/Pip domain-containing protein [Paenibacillus glufosinatiresistens]|uniref:YhgE/Pip domain-containing protein n=1 Tax=Paenibacillus glufosinatiresistens TaxID=3070657 RepID=UPI00286E3DC8|nr:ABC transporter permease [Paenibacillus sp. YX.27]
MKSFLKNKGIMAGAFMMLFYQIIMISIFMWGYSAVPKNVTDLKVAIVNEDQETGTRLAAQLSENLPFKLVDGLSLEKAKTELNERDLQLVIHIPQNFTAKMTAQGEQANLDFLVNQSNSQMITSSIQNVVNQISKQLVAQTQTQSFTALLEQTQMPKEQAEQTVNSVMNKISPNIISTHVPPAGMHNLMAPMFLSMASYVGAMIYSMMSIGALNKLKGQLGKGRAFLSLQGVNVLLSLIVPLVGVSIYFGIHGYGAEAFIKTWLTHSLEMFAAIEFTSIFCILAGQAGMLINMPLVLIQSIACGAAIPQEMMPGFFKFMSYISPMFYSVHLDYNTLFGGGGTSGYLTGLALLAAGALLVNTVIHSLKPAGAKKAPAAEAEAAGVPSVQM